MARIKFRQFEKELQPVQQDYSVPAFQDAPPPENKISEVLLSENRAYENLGRDILNLGATASKIVAKEQSRIRKDQWDNTAKPAMAELNRKLYEQNQADIQGGLTPTDIEINYPENSKRILGEMRNSDLVQGLHPDDQTKLMALMVATVDSTGVKALRQAYTRSNELKLSNVVLDLEKGLEEQYRIITSRNFNRDENGEGNGHNMVLEEFQANHVNGPAASILKNVLTKHDTEDSPLSPAMKERIKIKYESLKLNFQTKALSHHEAITTSIATKRFYEDLKKAAQTESLKINKQDRRRIGDLDDERIEPLKQMITDAFGQGLITEDQAKGLEDQIEKMIDRNDVEQDIRLDPRLALARLRLDPFTKKEKIEFFREYGIELDEKGNPTERLFIKTGMVEAAWENLKANAGGFYPSIYEGGKERNSYIEKAQTALNEGKKADRKLAFQTLDKAVEELINPNTSSDRRQEILNPNFINDWRGSPNIKDYELDQYNFLFEYATEISERVGNFKDISEDTLKNIEIELNPDNMKFKAGDDKDNFKKSKMMVMYNAFKQGTKKLREVRAKDQAFIGVSKAMESGIDPASEEGVITIVGDQLNYKGFYNLSPISSDPQPFPSPRELRGMVLRGEISLMSEQMESKFENDWQTFTTQGTGSQKKRYLDKKLGKYGDYAPVILEQLYKLEGFSRQDQFYSIITNDSVLNNFNDAQKQFSSNKENLGVTIFPEDDMSFKKVRKEIAGKEVINDFLRTFPGQGQDHEALIDGMATYLMQLASKHPEVSMSDLIQDAEKRSVFSHLIDSQYKIIGGGPGDNVKVRIPNAEMQGRKPDTVDEGLRQFTKGLLRTRSKDPNWNFVGLEDAAWFGDDLYQWKTNSDESGLILSFYNTTTGRYEPALYEGQSTILTWERLRDISDKQVPSIMSLRGMDERILTPLINEFQKDQFYRRDALQRTLEEIDLQNTPLGPLHDEKQKKILKKQKERDKRKEEEIIKEQQEFQDRGIIAKEESQKKGQQVQLTPGLQASLDIREMTYRDLEKNDGKKLTEKEIKKLLKMTNEKAEAELAKMGF